MNKTISLVGTIMNLAGVVGFALSMIFGSVFAGYVTSIFIAFGFIVMMCAFSVCRMEQTEIAGGCAMVFGAMYAVMILIVYFTQLTTVRQGGLSVQAAQILDYRTFGLFFSYDLLGYGFMAIATFFAGFTIKAADKADKWLKWLLHIHGIFAISCFIMPILGVFHSGMQNTDWIGTALLEFWCIYFLPINLLTYRYFRKMT
jgi:hypothetical protein